MSEDITIAQGDQPQGDAEIDRVQAIKNAQGADVDHDPIDDLADAVIGEDFGDEQDKEQPEEAKPEPEPEPKQEDEPLSPPDPWDDEAKQVFNTLPREAQEKMLGIYQHQDKALNKKLQALSEKEKSVEPWQALINRIAQDDGFRQHVFGYGQQPPAQQQTKPQGPPDDPIEAFKWEVRQEVLRELQPVLEPIQRGQQVTAQQIEIARTVSQLSADPLYRETHGKIIDFVKSQPPNIGGQLSRLLDSNPQAYMEYYQHYRPQVEAAAKAKPSTPPAPVAESETERAPFVERGGATAPDNASKEAQNAKRLKELRQKGKSGQLGLNEIDEWLDRSGLIDALA